MKPASPIQTADDRLPLFEQLARRPALNLAIGLALGIGSAYSFVFLAIIVAELIWLARTSARILALAASLVGFLLAPVIPRHGIEDRIFYQGPANVASMPSASAEGESCTIETARGRFLLLMQESGSVALGDTLYVTGVVKPLSEGTESYYLHRRIVGILTAARSPAVLETGWHLWHIAARARLSFERFAERTLGPQEAPILEALCFNVEAGLTDEEREELSRSGTVHIVSASGLHVVVVAWVLTLLFRGLPVPRWSQLVLLAVLLFIYAGAAGLRPPCVRAVLMSLLYASAYLFQREPDNLSALGIAAVPFLLISPESVFDIGFQLSFVTVGGLILFVQHLSIEGSGFWAKLWSLTRVTVRSSFAASLVSAPLVAYHFGFVSLASVPANLLIGAPVVMLVVIGIVGWLLSGILLGPVSWLMSGVAAPLIAWIRWTFTTLGGADWSAINVPPFSAFWLIPCYGFMLLVWKPYVRTA